MVRFLADENLNNSIVLGIGRRDPSIDIARVQEVGLSGADDPTVLEWAAAQGRVLLTSDVTTMTAFAYERVRQGKPMPGVFEISRQIPLRSVIDDLVLIAICSAENEWAGQVRYLPLR